MNAQMNLLEVKELDVAITEKRILKKISFTIKPGELVAVMGPNGAGKSTLAHALMGKPSLTTSGSIILDGKELLGEKPEERVTHGLFLTFQHPPSLPGVTLRQLLRAVLHAQRSARGEPRLRLSEFRTLVQEACERLEIPQSFLERPLEGLSGGEQKLLETLQLLLFKPKLAVLDEIDSGLDIDALKKVAQGIKAFRNETNGVLLITHYQRILNHVAPERVLILKDGAIVKEGGPELARALEEHGYSLVDS